MEDPEFYLDKTWRVSRQNHQFGPDPTLTRSTSTSKPPSFLRSGSQKRSNKQYGSTSSLSKSSSVRINHHASPPSMGLRRSASTRNHYSPDHHQGGGGGGGLRKITKKCSAMAKEQKARFYIMKRCVAMLVRWRKHGDS